MVKISAIILRQGNMNHISIILVKSIQGVVR